MADEKSTTSKPTRITMLVIALLFLFSASAFTVVIIIDAVTSHKSDDKPQVQTTLAGTKLKGFTPVKDVKKLKIIDLKKGSGPAVKKSDDVTVDYTGAVAATGTIFQSTKDLGQPATFGLNSVIPGWTKGLPGMKVGGERRLVIPADEAYGKNPPPNSGIPPNAALVFDITLKKID